MDNAVPISMKAFPALETFMCRASSVVSKRSAAICAARTCMHSMWATLPRPYELNGVTRPNQRIQLPIQLVVRETTGLVQG